MLLVIGDFFTYKPTHLFYLLVYITVLTILYSLPIFTFTCSAFVVLVSCLLSIPVLSALRTV